MIRAGLDPRTARAILPRKELRRGNYRDFDHSAPQPIEKIEPIVKRQHQPVDPMEAIKKQAAEQALKAIGAGMNGTKSLTKPILFLVFLLFRTFFSYGRSTSNTATNPRLTTAARRRRPQVARCPTRAATDAKRTRESAHTDRNAAVAHARHARRWHGAETASENRSQGATSGRQG